MATPMLSQGKFFTGDFRTVKLYDRWQARVEVGYVDQDFIKNLVTVRAEERIALAVTRPLAVVYGSL